VTTTLLAFLFKKKITDEVDDFISSYKAVKYVKYKTDYFEDIDEVRNKDVEIITTTRDIRDLIKFNGFYYAATSGGLLKLDEFGKRLKVYTNNNGLLSGDIRACRVFNNTLFLLSADGGLTSVTPYGSVNNFYLEGYEDKEIIKLINYNDKLLMVLKDDIISFDGDKFSLYFAPEVKLTGIMSADVFDGALFLVCADGIYELSNGKVQEKMTPPVEDITGFLKAEGKSYVSSLDGVYEVSSNGAHKKVLSDIYVNDIDYFNERLLAASFPGRIHLIYEDDEREFALEHNINGIRIIGNKVFILTSNGIYELQNDTLNEFLLPGKTELSSNSITSICMDDKGYIYTGTFESGIDILDSDLRFDTNISSNNIKEINSLVFDEGRVYAGHTLGIAIIKGKKLVEEIKKRDGLIGENISSIKKVDGSLYIATERGLSVLQNSILKNIYAFHGLVSNKVYAIEEFNGKAIVGTLGGISVVDGLEVMMNVTHGNSGLSNNWVTALISDGDNLYIGTYGGGVDIMDKDYNIKTNDSKKLNANINFNALKKCDEKILAGSVNYGIINIKGEGFQQSYASLSSLLPSKNVTSFLVFDEYLLVGTDKGLLKAKRNINYDEKP
jgi:ligand-binding sensor domain-containing protein